MRAVRSGTASARSRTQTRDGGSRGQIRAWNGWSRKSGVGDPCAMFSRRPGGGKQNDRLLHLGTASDPATSSRACSAARRAVRARRPMERIAAVGSVFGVRHMRKADPAQIRRPSISTVSRRRYSQGSEPSSGILKSWRNTFAPTRKSACGSPPTQSKGKPESRGGLLP